MVRLISRQRGSLAALKLTKLFGINDFPAAKDSGKVLIIIIYCYLIIIIIYAAIIVSRGTPLVTIYRGNPFELNLRLWTRPQHSLSTFYIHFSWISAENHKIKCFVGETNRHFATRFREHLTSDKNSHIFQQIYGSETCRTLCSENSSSIFYTASTSFQLKIKEALHIGWENPSLKKQLNDVNITLSF